MGGNTPGLGYTSVLHSVAAVYEPSIVNIMHANYAVCRPEKRSTVNTTVNTAR